MMQSMNMLTMLTIDTLSTHVSVCISPLVMALYNNIYSTNIKRYQEKVHSLREEWYEGVPAYDDMSEAMAQRNLLDAMHKLFPGATEKQIIDDIVPDIVNNYMYMNGNLYSKADISTTIPVVKDAVVSRAVEYALASSSTSSDDGVIGVIEPAPEPTPEPAHEPAHEPEPKSVAVATDIEASDVDEDDTFDENAVAGATEMFTPDGPDDMDMAGKNTKRPDSVWDIESSDDDDPYGRKDSRVTGASSRPTSRLSRSSRRDITRSGERSLRRDTRGASGPPRTTSRG